MTPRPQPSQLQLDGMVEHIAYDVNMALDGQLALQSPDAWKAEEALRPFVTDAILESFLMHNRNRVSAGRSARVF